MIVNIWMGFDDRAQVDANPSGDDPSSAAYRALGDPVVRSIYRIDNPVGPRSYENWSMYFNLEAEQEVIDIRNDLLTEYSGQLRTLGSWWWDGRQVGTEFEYGDVTREINDPFFNQTDVPNPDYQPDEEEPDYDPRLEIPDPNWSAPDPWPQIEVTTNEIIGTTGQPIFPLHNSILEYMPDIVTYDEDGNEMSRTRPTEPSDVNLGMGQAPRRFD